MSTDLEALGAVVRRLREERGWTQDDLIRMSGERLSRSVIQSVEGARHEPRPTKLRAIAEAFEIDVPELRRLVAEQQASGPPAPADVSPSVRRAIERSGLSDKEILAALRDASNKRAG